MSDHCDRYELGGIPLLRGIRFCTKAGARAIKYLYDSHENLHAQLARAQEALRETRYMLSAEDRPGWVKVNAAIRAQVEAALSSPNADSWLAEHDARVLQEERHRAAQTEAWLIGRIDEELRRTGLPGLSWTDGGGSSCPTGWHRNPYLNSVDVAEKLADAEAKGRAEALKEAADRAGQWAIASQNCAVHDNMRDLEKILRALAKPSEPTK